MIHLKRSHYLDDIEPVYDRGEVLTAEEFSCRINPKAKESYLKSLKGRETFGAGRFIQEESADPSIWPELPTIIFDQQISPFGLAHEMGHSVDPFLFERAKRRDILGSEVYAWKYAFKEKLKHGFPILEEDIEDAVDGLMSHINPKIYHAEPGSKTGREFRLLYRKTRSLVNRIVKQARKELREEGEL